MPPFAPMPSDPAPLGSAVLPFELRALPGEFEAAEVVGLDREAASASSEAKLALRDALAAHAVLCIRLDKGLDEPGFRALAELFGEIKRPVGRTRDGSSLAYDVERQVIDAGFVITDEIREKLGAHSFGGNADRPGLFEYFHTDDTYTEAPAAATIIHARALPAGGGGDTEFLDMRAAFDRLPAAERARIAALRAVHVYNNQGAFLPRPPAAGPPEALVEVSHPVIRTHPLTGRGALYFDLDRALAVTGLEPEAGCALLQALQDHAEAHALRYAHAWRPHDALIWDNASVQHRARGDFALGEPRRLWRFLIAGPAPI